MNDEKKHKIICSECESMCEIKLIADYSSCDFFAEVKEPEYIIKIICLNCKKTDIINPLIE